MKIKDFFFLFILAIFAGCSLLESGSDDEDPPEFLNITPDGSSTVFGLVQFEIEFQDDRDVSSVQIIISQAGGSDVLNRELRDSPFTVDWNTEDVEDGIYQVFIEAKGNGETISESFNIEVSNALITFVGVDGWRFDNAYIWLTDPENGSVIDYVKIVDGIPNKEKLMRNGFAGAKFDFHQFEYYRDATYSDSYDSYLYSYHGLTPGIDNYDFPDHPDYRSDYAGSANIYLENLPVHGFGFLTFNGSLDHTKDNGFVVGTPYDVWVYNTNQDNSLYFLLEQNGTFGYQTIPGNTIDVDADIYLDASNLNTLVSFVNVQSDIPLSNVYYYNRERDNYFSSSQRLYYNWYDLEENITEVFMPTPTGIMDNYNVEFYYGYVDASREKYAYMGSYDNPQGELVRINADIFITSDETSSVSLDVTGSYDYIYYRVYGRHVHTASGNYDYHYWYPRSGDGNMRFPDFPTELQSEFPGHNAQLYENGEYKGVYASVRDFDNIDGYEDFIDRVFYRSGKLIGDDLNLYRGIYIARGYSNSARIERVLPHDQSVLKQMPFDPRSQLWEERMEGNF